MNFNLTFNSKVIFQIFVFLSFSTFSIAQPADNEELKKMYETDQSDRSGANINWEIIWPRDSIRMNRVTELVALGKVITAMDHYNAAMIFQHGNDTLASGMAVAMMKKAVLLDPSTDKWLLAAAIDRDLMYKQLPQIYGTQYTKQEDGPWELYTIDTTRITDLERKVYHVETLAQQMEKVTSMNKKALSGLLDQGMKFDSIASFCKTVKKQNIDSEYDTSEGGLNSWGYDLLQNGKLTDALAVFRLNTELYPSSYNTWDSLGECLLKMGLIDDSVDAYTKSLQFKPNNKNALKVLEEYKNK